MDDLKKLAKRFNDRFGIDVFQIAIHKDEATAFADPDNEAKVQAAFARLAKGKTVLMIAHRLSTVANADCIYVVQDGQIVESGTKDELCAQNGLFARMWQEYQASVQWKVAKEG